MNTERLAYSAANCSIARSLAIVGEKWTLLILREAFYGLHRFDDYRRAVGCAPNILGDRLRTLVECELLSKEPYRDEGQRERFEYRLTPRGRDLFPVVVALMKWGDRWLADPAGPAVSLVHHTCGAPVDVVVRCEQGHLGLRANDVHAVPGPGARPINSAKPKKRRAPAS